jgi:pyruvate/2-oxoglutarate dehydrogenase complex dihydrolipoamide acyltransferase (E2) component
MTRLSWKLKYLFYILGMYGVKSASPIVLAPQACALALGAIIDSVVPRLDKKEGDEDWVIAPVMVATLSCDHRVG